jgi:hypothetical protein
MILRAEAASLAAFAALGNSLGVPFGNDATYRCALGAARLKV